jgi:hypothetical protein
MLPWRDLDGVLAGDPALEDTCRRRYWSSDNQPEGWARLHRLNGWTALAFWDRSCDTRGGSNSALIARGEHTAAEMVELFRRAFPAVWERITRRFQLVLPIEEGRSSNDFERGRQAAITWGGDTSGVRATAQRVLSALRHEAATHSAPSGVPAGLRELADEVEKMAREARERAESGGASQEPSGRHGVCVRQAERVDAVSGCDGGSRGLTEDPCQEKSPEPPDVEAPEGNR